MGINDREGAIARLARPVVRNALRHAQLYGYLVARHGRLYHPGANNPLCDVQTSKDIVRSGWLRFRSGKYEITPEGLRMLAMVDRRHTATMSRGEDSKV